MKYLSILFIAASLTFFACTKTETGIEATLEWHGAYEVDGCGFFIKFEDSTLYKPIDESIIPDEFKNQYSTDVIIDYKLPFTKTELICGLQLKDQDAIEMVSIKEK